MRLAGVVPMLENDGVDERTVDAGGKPLEDAARPLAVVAKPAGGNLPVRSTARCLIAAPAAGR